MKKAGTERTQRELLFNCSRPDHNIKRDLVGNMEKIKYLATTVKKIENQIFFLYFVHCLFFKQARPFGSQLCFRLQANKQS
jgi:hypothetical protein